MHFLGQTVSEERAGVAVYAAGGGSRKFEAAHKFFIQDILASFIFLI
jgi:hypothetical protein